jgi:hypothetical protein
MLWGPTFPSARTARGPQTAENAALAGLSDAPREIRTPTVQTDHKALNLARYLPVLPTNRRSQHPVQGHGRSGLGGRGVCCHGVVTRRSERRRWPRALSAVASLTTTILPSSWCWSSLGPDCDEALGTRPSGTARRGCLRHHAAGAPRAEPGARVRHWRCQLLISPCGFSTNFLAAPWSKSLYPRGASSREMTVAFTAFAICARSFRIICMSPWWYFITGH